MGPTAALGAERCVFLPDIRYSFYVRHCLFMDVCDFSRPHISSLCALTCALIPPSARSPCVIVLPARARVTRGRQRLSTFRSARRLGRMDFPLDQRAARLRLSFSSFPFKFNLFFFLFSYPSALCFILDLFIISPVISSTLSSR